LSREEFKDKKIGIWSMKRTCIVLLIIKGTSNNLQFVPLAPYQVWGKLRRESSYVKSLWIPAFAGMTFLGEALMIYKRSWIMKAKDGGHHP
jgi:hypothetical protein